MRREVYGGIAFCLLAAGVWFGWPKKSARGVAVPEASTETLNFGEVWAQSDFSWLLKLRNPSRQDIEIAEFRCTPCGCCRYDPPSLLIPAGEDREVRLTVDLSPRRDEGSQPTREVRITVSARLSGSTNGLVSWDVVGRVRHAVHFDPVVTDFTDALVEEVPPPERLAIVHAHQPLRDVQVESDDGQVRAVVERDAAEPDKYRLRLTPSVSLPPGPLETKVWVKSTLPSGEALPPIAYRIRGDVQPVVYASPASVAFGVRRRGEQAKQSIVLRSRLGESLRILAAKSSLGVIRRLPSDDEAAANDAADSLGSDRGNSLELELTCDFPTVGPLSGRSEIEVESANGKRTVVVVPVHAHVEHRDPTDGENLTR